jgi:4-hydroxy-tetrahydrodipicolinate synthase
MKIKGIIPPLLTPFDDDGNVDETQLRSLVDFLKPYVQGLFVCGSYGSGALMQPDERERVFEIVQDQVGNSLLLIAHVGSANTATSLRLARHAQKHGAQAIAAVPPYYFSYGDQALRDYFIAIIQAVDLPVYAYDNPKTTGNPLSISLLNDLSQNGLAGLKDSSFDIGKLYMALRSVRGPDFDFVIGSESLMLPAFRMGVQGCIAGLANVFPEAMLRFYKSLTQGGQDEARLWQMNILRLWDVLHIGPSVPTAYTILSLRGQYAGRPRRPMLPLEGKQIEKVKQSMDELDEIWNPKKIL